MRLKVAPSPAIVENANTTTTLNAVDEDINSNDNLPNDKLSSFERTGKWVWSSVEDLNNYSYNKAKLEPFDLVEAAQLPTKHPDTPSPSSLPDYEEGESGTSSCGDYSDLEEVSAPSPKVTGFANPNYPGFGHLEHELHDSFNNNNNNNNNNDYGEDEKDDDPVNRLCSEDTREKEIYRRPKLNIPVDLDEVKETNTNKMEVAMVTSSSHQEKQGLHSVKEVVDPNRKAEEKGEGDSRKREKTEANKNVKKQAEQSCAFDVYNIETAMPKIDLEAIESHLRAAREEERRRRNDREEIRRRLATGCDSDEYYGSGDKPGKKPSLQARLQSGMNLQICFMNETSSDTESPSSESPSPSSAHTTTMKSKLPTPDPPKGLNFSQWVLKQREPQILTADPTAVRLPLHQIQAVAQNKEPVLPLIVRSLNRVGVTLPEGRRRVTRQILTNMNVAQLQVIVNDLHTHIEQLNEGLMSLLMERDELHMSQDSMLVDIEDITRFLSAKESYLKEDTARNNNLGTTTSASNASNVSKSQTTLTKPVITRIVSLGKK
ncbi:schwannomin interacting protein 1 isoform X2 [Rhodnius prolixus]